MSDYQTALNQLIKNHRFQVTESGNGIQVKCTRGFSRFVVVPSSLTSELAYLVGLFYGDGHLRKDTQRLALTNVNK